MTLDFSDVSFRYRPRRWVFQDFSFCFPSGSTVLLGPNGAGKSTLLGLGASTLRPQRGVVSVAGLSAARARDRKRYRQQITWMPQQIRPIPGLTSREQVAYVGWLKGLSRVDAWSAAAEALETVGLLNDSETRARELSGGQLRRLGVAQAIVHAAELALMDEPTAGLDPEQRSRFRMLIERIRSRAELIVSTHQTEDIVESYDNVVVLVSGRVLFSGSVSEFLNHASSDVSDGRRAESAYGRILEQQGLDSA